MLYTKGIQGADRAAIYVFYSSCADMVVNAWRCSLLLSRKNSLQGHDHGEVLLDGRSLLCHVHIVRIHRVSAHLMPSTGRFSSRK